MTNYENDIQVITKNGAEGELTQVSINNGEIENVNTTTLPSKTNELNPLSDPVATGQKNIISVDEASSVSSGNNIYINQDNKLMQIDYDTLATAILNKLSTQSFNSLNTSSKLVLDAINELNGNINVDYVNEYKTQSYQPSQFVPFYSETLTGGLFLCVAWAEATASIDASMTLSIQGAIERAIAVRGSMLNGGGMIVTTFVDARSVPRQINFQIYNGHTTAVEIMTRANIIKLR